MEFKLKDMYSYLLSHTFPGLFFGIEILLALKWFTPFDILAPIQIELSKPQNTGTIIALAIASYAFSTLLGFILDGIHHFVYEDFLREEKDENIFYAVNNIERMQLYTHFVEDDYWYPYEAYANISIAMIPGIFLLPYKLFISNVNIWVTMTMVILYIFVLFIIVSEARSTYKRCCERERQIIDSWSFNSKQTVEVVDDYDDEVLKDILFINRNVFPNGWQYHDAEDYYKNRLQNKNSIHILLKDDGNRVGYLHAIPHNEAVEELKNDDPAMSEDENAYYIETVGILPAFRKKRGFSKMLAAFINESKKRGITKFSLHARVNNKFSEIIQKKFKVAPLRRIQKWKYYNFEEPTDYIEVPI